MDVLPTTPQPPMPATSDTPATPAITGISITPNSGSVTAGESYSLQCTVTVTGSTDQPTITWLYDASSDPIITVSVTSGSAGSYSSRLMFNQLAASHAGTYTCRATLGSAVDSASTTITVQSE